ncbi:MAG: hypothetical protein WCO55_04190 [Candidatus Falkowbacteria bacterium]
MQLRLRPSVTLIELTISMAIFCVVMVIALDSFTKTIKYTRESVQRQSLQDHAQFLFELMSKEIRFAKIKYDDHCDSYFNNLKDLPGTIENNQLYKAINDDTNNVHELRFINYEDVCVRYFLSPDPLNPASVQRLTIERYDSVTGLTKRAFVTPGTINVLSLYFNATDLVSQAGPGLRKPATVTYYMKLSSILWEPPTVDYFNFVTSRNFEQF